jgi:hypothetical protein
MRRYAPAAWPGAARHLIEVGDLDEVRRLVMMP